VPKINNKSLKIDLPPVSSFYSSILEEDESRYLAETRLYEFVKQAWHIVEGNEKFVESWHIEAICRHLECVYLGIIKKLIINVPPRSSKSTIVSVMFPVWVFIQDSSKKLLNCAHSIDVSQNNVINCRNIIQSEWFQFRWGHKCALSRYQKTKKKIETTSRGRYEAVSIGGSITGKGADIRIADDPNDAGRSDSEAILNSTNQWMSSAWATRGNNLKESSEILIQQRVNMMDVTGFMLEHDTDKKFVKLILPMRFCPERRARTIVLPGSDEVWQDPRKKPGELLWPHHVGEEDLKELEDTLRASGGEYRVSGQMQQQPAPDDAGILKKSKFIWWKKERSPKIDLTISTWDTALVTGNLAAYSAVTTWGLFKSDDGVPAIILLGMLRIKVEFPELKELAMRLYEDYRDDGKNDIVPDSNHGVDIVLIESKASGNPLIQSLRRAGINAVGFNPPPDKDKVGRARVASAFLESGQVYVPAYPPNYVRLRPMAEKFVDICSVFPMDPKGFDVVDTFSQVVLYMQKCGYLSNRFDPVVEKKRFENEVYY